MRIQLPLIPPEPDEPVRFGPTDLAIAAALFVIAAAVSYANSGFWGPFVPFQEFENLYFHADLNTVYSNLVSRASNHYRTSAHPLFSIIGWPLTAALQLTGLSGVTSVRILLAVVAGLVVATLYAVLRLLTLRALDAALFAGLLIATGSFVFWATVPETFAFGGLSILLALVIFAVRRDSPPALVLASVLALSFTITNWMVACYGTLTTQTLRKAIRIFAIAFAITATLWTVQRLTFSRSGAPGKVGRYAMYVRLPEKMDMPVLLAGSVIAPEPAHSSLMGRLQLSAEKGAFELRDPLVTAGVALWTLLLVGGGVAMARAQGRRALRLIIALTLGSQILLHAGFADGPFLYGMHYLPLLILVAAHGSLTRLRPFVIAALVALIPIALIHNLDVHRSVARDLHTDLAPEFEARPR